MMTRTITPPPKKNQQPPTKQAHTLSNPSTETAAPESSNTEALRVSAAPDLRHVQQLARAHAPRLGRGFGAGSPGRGARRKHRRARRPDARALEPQHSPGSSEPRGQSLSVTGTPARTQARRVSVNLNLAHAAVKALGRHLQARSGEAGFGARAPFGTRGRKRGIAAASLRPVGVFARRGGRHARRDEILRRGGAGRGVRGRVQCGDARAS
eukprot:168532-Rhodomonas_salina.1